jgi:hypothetical protein
VRPSPGTLIAVLALFVALGGPAQARTLLTGKDIKTGTLTGKHLKKSTLTGKHLKDRSVGTADLSPAAVQSLTSTPPGSVSEAALGDGAVTGAKLAAGSVGGAQVADQSLGRADLGADSVGPEQLTPNSVLGSEVEDGRLAARDVGAFVGTFTHAFGAINADTCGTHDVSVAPIVPGASAQDDVVVVTPPPGFPTDRIMLSATAESAGSLRVRACNVVGAGAVNLGSLTYRFVSLDL